MTVRGDTQTLVATFYESPGGAVADVTGVELRLLFNGATAYGPWTTPAVIHDATGRYRYEWLVPNDAPFGVYTAQWSGTLPDEAGPSLGYEAFTVTAVAVEPSDPPLPDFCWPVDTSAECVPDWDAWEVEPVEADPEADPPVEAVEGVPVYSDLAKARAIALAGQSMRLLTAYRVGGCPITVRPCRQGCSDPTWRSYPVRGPGSTPWHPVQLGGTWLNIGCGHGDGCSCSRVCEVRLHGPASLIEAVKVDGVTLDEDAYRLDLGGRLIRTDGECWPICQNMDAPDTEPGTWSVTYLAAQPVDGLGAWAAGLLAGQYVKACSGMECELPSTVTQVVRQNVTQTIAPGAFPNGKTGIKTVDAYLERWNPEGHRGQPSTVWSPDMAAPRVMGP